MKPPPQVNGLLGAQLLEAEELGRLQSVVICDCGCGKYVDAGRGVGHYQITATLGRQLNGPHMAWAEAVRRN